MVPGEVVREDQSTVRSAGSDLVDVGGYAGRIARVSYQIWVVRDDDHCVG